MKTMFVSNHEDRNRIEKSKKFLDKYNTDMIKCPKCNGTGLKMNIHRYNITIWNGEYCDFCKGLGCINKPEEIKKSIFIKIISFFLRKLHGWDI